MSDKAITPFQRRLEYWENTHIRQTISSVGDKIAISINKHQKQMKKAANNIIVSQERIAKGLEEISLEIDRVSNGLESLAAVFDWGFSEIAWQLEQARDLLVNIKRLLEAPLDTQAKELRKRAEEAYKNGWMDDALWDFIESEKRNRYDFIVHQYLGNIYFFEKKNPDKALLYYEKALKYSKPKSPYHASIALLHIGLIKYLQENFEEAYQATSEAIQLTPNLWEAHYQHAQYCSILGKYDEAIKHLTEAIKFDLYYLIKADLEKDFDVMKEQLLGIFEVFRNLGKELAQEKINKAKELIQDAEANDAYKYSIAEEAVNSAKDNLKKSQTFFGWDSVFDYYESYYYALISQEEAIESSIEALKRQISNVSDEYKEKSEKNEKKKKSLFRWSYLIVPAMFVISGSIFRSCLHAFLFGGITFLIFYIYRKSPFSAKKSYEAKLNNLRNKLSERQEIQSQLKEKRT
ncbi:MAG: CDC27 family protein [Candidatus Hodarchaeota archaeon]